MKFRQSPFSQKQQECHRLNPWHSSSQDSKNWSIIPQRIIATHFSIAVAKQPRIWSNVYKDKLTHHLTKPENGKLKPLVKLSEASDLTRLTVQTWNELKPRVHLSWMQISNLASLLKKSMVKRIFWRDFTWKMRQITPFIS